MNSLLDQIKKGVIEFAQVDGDDVIQIIVAGDLCPDRIIEKLAIEDDLDKLYNNALPELIRKDLSIVNLECPITESHNPIDKQGPNLVAKPISIKSIKKGQFDVVTLANNHILDQNENGLLDTIKHCNKAGIKSVGAGGNINEAAEYAIFQVKDVTVAILNFAEVEFSGASINKAGANPLDPIKNYYQIISALDSADIVLVIVHGGIENYNLPSPGFVEALRYFADLKVTAVIAHHSHCPGGLEIRNGVPIFYSLGNFLFDRSYGPPHWHESFLIRLSFQSKKIVKIDLIPYFQFKNMIGLQLMDGLEKQAFLDKIAALSQIIYDQDQLCDEFNKFCSEKRIRYLSIALSLNKYQKKLLKHDIGTNLILKKERMLRLLNTHQCRSHRDIMTNTLEKELFSMSK